MGSSDVGMKRSVCEHSLEVDEVDEVFPPGGVALSDSAQWWFPLKVQLL